MAAGLKIAVLGLVLLGLAACTDREVELRPTGAGGSASLAAHSAEFERRVYDVTDGVHVAVGYGLANSILIEGDDGVIVVDTMESIEAARDVRAQFDLITHKPVAAIIYTHNHPDHTFGASVFAGDDPPPIYAHESTGYYLDRIVNVIRPAIYRRSMCMFGNYLPPGGLINDGIGPSLRSGHGGGTPGLLRPTVTFSDRLDVTIAGVSLRLVHAPGETNDQIFVWLPAKRVLLPGDNFYRSFPNLYTIRGTPYRDVLAWVKSLDKIRALSPAYLVPSHTRPISGTVAIRRILTDYRDAIQYVHDQTIRGINRGLDPGELVEFVKLPRHLAKSPYLQEYYGKVEWSVRSIFTGYLGWFGGNAAYLSPLSPRARARRLEALARSGQSLLDNARQAIHRGDYQWAAELADHSLRLHPDLTKARELEAEALLRLAERQQNANGHNFYLTTALALAGKLSIERPDLSALPDAFIRSLPISGIIEAMAVNLKAENSLDTDEVVGFRFPDVGEGYTVHVRRGVAEIRPVFPEHPDVAITVDSTVWKNIAIGRRNPVLAVASGEIGIDGSVMALVKFLALFERPTDDG